MNNKYELQGLRAEMKEKIAGLSDDDMIKRFKAVIMIVDQLLDKVLLDPVPSNVLDFKVSAA